jgi:hypothetical protein
MNKPLWEQHRDRIDALEKLQLNFDLERRHEYTSENGWNVDEHEAELPPEPPGPPLPDGSWEAAKGVLRDYKFPPPDLITGIFYPDRPLDKRLMLLRGRFMGLTFYFGVRIGGVVDTTREGEHGPEQVWGYNYQTLQGHFERGQIDFEIIKRLNTGEVIFHIQSFSQVDVIRNPFYRIGFKIFGRPLQKRFARDAMARMQRLVAEQLATGRPPVAASPPVKPADTAAEEKLDSLERGE